MESLAKIAAPVSRLLLSFMFIMAGLNKIGSYDMTQGYMEVMGVPGGLLSLVIGFEVILGVALLLGFKARVAALGLAVYCIVAGVIFHGNVSDQNEMIHLMKNFTVAGGLLMVTLYGAGAYSFDNRKT